MKLELPPLPGGTVPFRAADLCDHDPLPRTLYRHDLESFFFVLIWMALYRANKPIDRHFKRWSTGSWSGIREYKEGFLISHVNAYLPQDLPLRASWIEPLWKAFGSGYEAKLRFPGTADIDTRVDEETLSNHISYNMFMGIFNKGL